MNIKHISVKKLGIGDGPTFKRIWLEALKSTPSSYASTLADWELLPGEEWERRISNPIFLALSAGHPIGMMGLIRKPPGKLKHRATIVMAYVNKDFRRTGAASQLLHHISAFAKADGITQLELCVSAENPSALAFYRSQGFSKLCVMPGGIIENGRMVDEVQMLWKIAPSR
ncbi:GNAT family N-acetyltransferase (plasmid) [Rhizobium rhizogenes]|uniref:GNAT family N-acetyltransferase n=1 Tax=Rhizobium rhizogenes TaxID=359 RepID=UPI00157249CC|nr:GNAT family N-acetyltransferase [Rhizobium rhizogenes]NTI26862.1 GNAT family N-acetyltransferase [Rhizobium rhizogenes]QTG10251.1 GNAT family N-acetyltransferase [Rhizobium rhizogenes]